MKPVQRSHKLWLDWSVLSFIVFWFSSSQYGMQDHHFLAAEWELWYWHQTNPKWQLQIPVSFVCRYVRSPPTWDGYHNWELTQYVQAKDTFLFCNYFMWRYEEQCVCGGPAPNTTPVQLDSRAQYICSEQLPPACKIAVQLKYNQYGLDIALTAYGQGDGPKQWLA